MKEIKRKYVFGPVPSRRLGMSLGIDLVPFKTCSYNCVYCECGRTTNKIIKRHKFFPVEEIKREINDVLKEKPKIDYLTFSGSGEPTLNNDLGEIAKYLNNNYPSYKTALITNSSLLYTKDVINEISFIDVILPSLDASSTEIFNKINDPYTGVCLNNILKGLYDLTSNYQGEIWLEIFIIPGINDSDLELEKIKRSVLKIKPYRIQVNSLDRPAAQTWVKPLSENNIEKIKNILCFENLEFIAYPYSNITKTGKDNKKVNKQEIINTILRRPSTIDDICRSTGLNKNEISIFLKEKVKERKIFVKTLKRGVFYTLNERSLE